MAKGSRQIEEVSSIYQEDRDYKELARWIQLSIERYREQAQKSQQKRHVLRCYRASIEKPKTSFFKEEKKHVMNAIKIDTKTSNQEAC